MPRNASSRERQIKFMATYFTEDTVKKAIFRHLSRNRMALIDLLSDEMVADVTSEMISDLRWQEKINRQNRRIYAANKARAA